MRLRRPEFAAQYARAEYDLAHRYVDIAQTYKRVMSALATANLGAPAAATTIAMAKKGIPAKASSASTAGGGSGDGGSDEDQDDGDGDGDGDREGDGESPTSASEAHASARSDQSAASWTSAQSGAVGSRRRRGARAGTASDVSGDEAGGEGAADAGAGLDAVYQDEAVLTVPGVSPDGAHGEQPLGRHVASSGRGAGIPASPFLLCLRPFPPLYVPALNRAFRASSWAVLS